MNAHFFQHVPFEGLGNIETWLMQRGYSIGCTRMFANETLPAPEDVNVLIIMGGPMSVNDEGSYPWLEEEKRFTRNFIATGKPVLGICLGAQMIASCLGARVYGNREKEIGWFDIERTGSASCFVFPEPLTVFQWHGETFDLPPGAVHLARSRICENQAFQIGNNVIGLQFHLETTRESAAALVDHCGDELIEGPYIQHSEDILAATDEHYKRINAVMFDVLEYLVGREVEQ
jgi:GMP synthase-like glutamine amidotransferase